MPTISPLNVANSIRSHLQAIHNLLENMSHRFSEKACFRNTIVPSVVSEGQKNCFSSVHSLIYAFIWVFIEHILQNHHLTFL